MCDMHKIKRKNKGAYINIIMIKSRVEQFVNRGKAGGRQIDRRQSLTREMICVTLKQETTTVF